MGTIREALDKILEEENKKEIDEELYDGEWTQEDEEDFNIYDDTPITPKQEQFYEEVKNVLQSLIDNGVEDLEEDFTSEDELNFHFKKHCLANTPNRKSTRRTVYYDFNDEQDYSNYENELNKNFQSNSNTIILSDPYNIEEVNDAFLQLFKNNTYIIFGWEWNLTNNIGIVQLRVHSFASNVTTNYKTNDTIDIIIRTPRNKSITLYAIDVSILKNKLFNILKKYSNLPLVKSQDNNKLLDSLNNNKTIDHKLCLQEDFPKEIKIFLNKNYDLINYKDFRWSGKNNKDFISDFLEGTELDIHKTEYKKASKEEIESISSFPVGTLIIKNHKNIPIIWFKTRFAGDSWWGYIAIKKPSNVWDPLKEKNVDIKEIGDQIYINDDEIKNIKDIVIYIPVKAIAYDYKTVRDLEHENIKEIETGIKDYLDNEFKVKDNAFWQLISRSNYRFAHSLGVAALNNVHSSSMKSKLAKWLISKGFYRNFSRHFEPKDIKNDLSTISTLTPKQISQLVLDTKKELDKLIQNYTQEKDNRIKKQILKEINRKRKEYSYYLAFTYNSNTNEISDTVGCYYLLKGLIDLIKKFINDEETTFADDEGAISKANVEYIRDIMKKTQTTFKDKVPSKALNQKSYEFYREVQDSLNSIVDQANKLIEELKHFDTNIEYDILKRTADIIDNFKDKVKAIDNMKKTVLKEDLEEISPYTSIKSNGIYSLNTGWVKHPVQQDIPDIDMEEFEKEFKAWEDRYFDLLDKVSLEQIDDLIEDVYSLRKEGMEEEGEYSIKNLIFKEFRNLGYLDNLKELRKKEISKELSLESLKEELIDYSNENEVARKTKEIMDVISKELKYPFAKYTSLGYLSYGETIEGCDYRDLVKLVVPHIVFNDTDYSVYFTDKLGFFTDNDYIITKKTINLQDLYKLFEDSWDEQEETLSKEEFEEHMFTIDKNANYVNIKLD